MDLRFKNKNGSTLPFSNLLKSWGVFNFVLCLYNGQGHTHCFGKDYRKAMLLKYYPQQQRYGQQS